ncbi:hypothetical protein B0H14DRAFT_2639411 [Mycena olivaceomarginata]|nr:hypothetical protein B0H14DRAFT_2639411 [Mycena olivaceomarginata]
MPKIHWGTVFSSDDNPPETPTHADTPPPSQTPAASAWGQASYTPGAVGLSGFNTPAVGSSTFPLPGSSPPLDSPESSPIGLLNLMDFLPLSSDGLIYTSPIVGNKKEHKAKEYAKGQKKRKITLASNVTAAEEQKYAIFDGILTELTDNRLTFGDLMLHVFNPIYKQGETRWQGFFRNHALATSILGFWVAPENGETVHEEEAARNVTSSKYLQTGSGTVDTECVDGFSIPKLHAYPQTHTGIIMKIFDVFATSTQNLHKDLPSRIVKRATIVTSAALALLGEFSHKNKFSQIFTVSWLCTCTTGAQR